jgi:hypothetical protein
VRFFQVFQEVIYTVLYRELGRVVHGYLFLRRQDFTTFVYHGCKVTTVPATRHPTGTANFDAFGDSPSASVNLVDEFFGLLEMRGEIALKALGNGFG